MRCRLLPLRSTLAAAALALASTAVADTWQEHYARGEEALQAQDWSKAIDELAQAIEARQDPAIGVTGSGGRTVNYLPYLKLGIAYYNVGQYEAALQAFERESALGAVARSPSDSQNLQTLQRLAQEALGGSDADKRKRAERFMAQTLEDARQLEWRDDLQGALAALGKILSIDPNHAEASAALERLRQRVAEEEHKRKAIQRNAELLREGRELEAAGRYEEAASRLRQALDVAPSPETQRLLEGALGKLRTEVQAQHRSQEQLVNERLQEALRLESQGKLVEALQSLETVLAVDRKNERALALHRQLLGALRQAERDRVQREQVAILLEQGREHLAQGQHEAAAATFNLVLALEPDNAAARAQLGSALEGFQPVDLTGMGIEPIPKIPPTVALLNAAIRGAAEREGSAAEPPAQRLTSPEFVLAGVAMDDLAALTVSYLRGQPDGTFTEEHAERLEGERVADRLWRFQFSRSFSLESGPTPWKVLVTDDDGLSSEALHLVRYDRPWARSLWPYVGLGVALVAGVGAYQGLRVRRRNQLFQRRFNPYIAGAPVLDDELFFGRQRLMSRVLQSIHNNSLLLYGERRIGKTSFQHHLKRRLQELDDPRYKFYPAYVDLQGVPQERFFATVADQIFEELAPLLDGRKPRSAGSDRYDYRHFLRDLHDVLAVLRERTPGKTAKLTLLIDEVDELNAYDPRVNQRLRSLFMKSFAENLAAVVTGVQIKKDWSSEGSPWYNFFEEIEVQPLSREEAEQLIQRPLRGVFKLEHGAVERILERTGCKPYRIQKLCMELVNRLHDERRRSITVADVDSVKPQAEA